MLRLQSRLRKMAILALSRKNGADLRYSALSSGSGQRLTGDGSNSLYSRKIGSKLIKITLYHNLVYKEFCVFRFCRIYSSECLDQIRIRIRTFKKRLRIQSPDPISSCEWLMICSDSVLVNLMHSALCINEPWKVLKKDGFDSVKISWIYYIYSTCFNNVFEWEKITDTNQKRKVIVIRMHKKKEKM